MSRILEAKAYNDLKRQAALISHKITFECSHKKRYIQQICILPML